MADQEETPATETTNPAPDTEETADIPAEKTDTTTDGPPEAGETADETAEAGDVTADGKTEEAPADQTQEETAKSEEKPKEESDGQVTEQVAEGETNAEEVEAKAGEGETKAEGEEDIKTEEGESKAEEGETKAEGDEQTEEGVAKAEGEELEGEKTEGEPKEGEGEGIPEAAEREAVAETKDDEAGVAEGEEGEKKDDEEKKEGEEGDKKEEDKEEGSKSPVPQSDTFAEGERAESPIGVGEKLSREGSPVQEKETTQPDKLEPGTPERSRAPSEAGEEKHLETFREEEEEEVEEEEEEEEQFDREALMEQYNNAIAEREKLQVQNYQLQHKLAEHFRKKKQDESRQDYDKTANDQDTKYVKYMGQLDELRKEDMHVRDTYEHAIEELKEKCEDRKETVDEERKKFMEFKKQVALNSVSNRSGKPIPPKDIDQYLSTETKKEQEVVNVRLENIKLKNKLKKKEIQLKSKEELAENLHLIDFEQLKIENQTYNEKIEERNEELLKLRKKITSTVQVLTHLKEKLQFVQAENQVQKSTLRQVESEAAQKRDILSRTKQARDALRIDNQRLRQSCGLLGNEPLLRDFEERKDEGDDLRERLERLKMQHAELTLNCNQVRRKIEQARATHG